MSEAAGGRRPDSAVLGIMFVLVGALLITTGLVGLSLGASEAGAVVVNLGGVIFGALIALGGLFVAAKGR